MDIDGSLPVELACESTAAKYPLPQRLQNFRSQFLEACDWLAAYNRGKLGIQYVVSGVNIS